MHNQMIRRAYKRKTTIERSVIKSHGPGSFTSVGESFRVEVIKTDGDTEMTVYAREHEGSIKVEEMTDGDFRLNGTLAKRLEKTDRTGRGDDLVPADKDTAI